MSGTATVSPTSFYSVRLFRPGLSGYDDATHWQDRVASLVRGGGPEYLALLQHPPVYTLGRRADPDHLLVDRTELSRRGALVAEADRGGDITFHGPGQLVGYPIIDLRRRGILPGDYVRMLERSLIEALATFGIQSERVAGRPGVWVDGAKIAAIGVRVRGGVTTHGFALNVTTDLSWFDAIVPCGLANTKVTSMAVLQSRPTPMSEVEAAVSASFARTFSSRLVSFDEPLLRPASGPGQSEDLALTASSAQHIPGGARGR